VDRFEFDSTIRGLWLENFGDRTGGAAHADYADHGQPGLLAS